MKMLSAPILLLPAALAVGLLAPRLARCNATSEPELPQSRECTATPMTVVPQASPFLWFRRDAEEALRFYAAVFEGAEVRDELRWGAGGALPEGTLLSASIELAGQRFLVLNGGPAPAFNDSFSILVRARTQAQIDGLWDRLIADGGRPGPCGWLKDRYGLSWQIVPPRLFEMLSDRDAERVQRVGAALMQMQKIDLARLERAYSAG